MPTPPPRLAMVRAARAPIAVIFRRGPSKLVEIIRWDFTEDSFERGQWFRGRIYEKRSDLSPDGQLLVYFASKFGRPTPEETESIYAWTAVSRAPWLTALALWPRNDCWAGGGLFTQDRTLSLNHKPTESAPHPDHPPTGLTVEPNPDAHGEDEPIYGARLTRDGWMLRREWNVEFLGVQGFRTHVPEERAKTGPETSGGISVVLERRMDSFRYRERFRIEGADREPELPPGPVDWVDWDRRGRLIALSGGRVWAAMVADGRVERFRELLDLRPDRFEEREPPAHARRW